VNGILKQINCKIGGVPYGIANMWGRPENPAQDAGTMVVGMAFFGKGDPGGKKDSYIAWQSTTDTKILEYYTFPYKWSRGGENTIPMVLREACTDAIAAYCRKNSDQKPRRVIVYREGSPTTRT